MMRDPRDAEPSVNVRWVLEELIVSLESGTREQSERSPLFSSRVAGVTLDPNGNNFLC